MTESSHFEQPGLELRCRFQLEKGSESIGETRRMLVESLRQFAGRCGHLLSSWTLKLCQRGRWKRILLDSPRHPLLVFPPSVLDRGVVLGVTAALGALLESAQFSRRFRRTVELALSAPNIFGHA